MPSWLLSRLPAVLLSTLRMTSAEALQPPPAMPSRAAVDSLLTRLVDGPRIPGISAGRIVDGSRQLWVAGRLDATRPDRVQTDTRFEIGSITKVFTGVLLADMVVRGEVSLDDPVARHLPSGIAMPTYRGAGITLRHLATHTSGLPGVPDNLSLGSDDPYADFDRTRLGEFLGRHQLRRPPGQAFEYSNLGSGLLGVALAHRAGVSYADLLTARILEPLGMARPVVGLAGVHPAGMAAGHDGMGRPTSAWRFDALASAGALLATPDDLLTFAAAALDTTTGPLAKAMALSQREWFRIDSASSVGLGWQRAHRDRRVALWHDGGTGGFRSMMLVEPTRRRAAVAFVNAIWSPEALAIHLLDQAVPMPAPPPLPNTVTVAPDRLARYPGVYRLTDQFSITITPWGTEGLHLQATGQQRFRIYPSSNTTFFLTEVEAKITFELDASGRVAGLVLQQGGVDQRAARAP